MQSATIRRCQARLCVRDNTLGELLCAAARQGQTDMVHLLLDAGVPVDCTGNNGKGGSTTPLMEAAYFGRQDVHEELLHAGAAVNRHKVGLH